MALKNLGIICTKKCNGNSVGFEMRFEFRFLLLKKLFKLNTKLSLLKQDLYLSSWHVCFLFFFFKLEIIYTKVANMETGINYTFL